MVLGCFDSYKIDYSEEFAFVLLQRSNEKSASVFAGSFCIPLSGIWYFRYVPLK
jgi:hypothetical protein